METDSPERALGPAQLQGLRLHVQPYRLAWWSRLPTPTCSSILGHTEVDWHMLIHALTIPMGAGGRSMQPASTQQASREL